MECYQVHQIICIYVVKKKKKGGGDWGQYVAITQESLAEKCVFVKNLTTRQKASFITMKITNIKRFKR